MELTEQSRERRVGFELEYAGVGPERVMAIIQDAYGGATDRLTDFEFRVHDTTLGGFRIELDADYLKKKGRAASGEDADDESFDWQRLSMDLLAAAAQLIVPWEVVTDPIPLGRLHELNKLCDGLRGAGALGTRYSVRYAFGVHLNPELPDLESGTILSYLRAYFCLYEWLHERETVDMSRKVTPYIDPFPEPYVVRLLAQEYAPDRSRLIDDYLRFNPTRNRSLDLLPLFSYLDAGRVAEVVDDPRIKARPTLHYRLPNSEIDRPDWSVLSPWRDWLQVEHLACDRSRLAGASAALLEDLGRVTRKIDNRWVKESHKWLTDLTSA